MKVNPGFLINKAIKMLNRPALRDCDIDKTTRVGAGSNCIRVKIGRYSYLGQHNSLCDVTIGSFCSIASYCAIGGGKHQISDNVSTSPVFYSGHNSLGKNFANTPEDKNNGVIIGHDVWIGEGVFISDGVEIGIGAVIGAHSVVTKDVPPYAIVAGSPARIIRYRFEEDIIQQLIDSKWWSWSEDELCRRGNDFSSIELFLK